MIVAGLDVWKGGWVAVVVNDGAVDRVAAYASLEDFIAEAADVAVIGIDIPLLLPTQPPRRADGEARAALGPRRSSVFNAPPLDVIEQPTYTAARQRSRDRYGIGLSAQSYALRTRILEARGFALTDERFIEVHPGGVVRNDGGPASPVRQEDLERPSASPSAARRARAGAAGSPGRWCGFRPGGRRPRCGGSRMVGAPQGAWISP